MFMSDRTWNQIDARLYEEDWSQGAIIIAACLLARCPNQYGVFDMPWGFLNLFFKGLYPRAEIEAYAVELEGAGFLKFYENRRIVWIRKKWRRIDWNKADTNKKGAANFLQQWPITLRTDFMTLYDLSITPSTPPVHPTNTLPTTDSESDSESDSEKEKGIRIPCPPSAATDLKPVKKPHIPLRLRNPKTNVGKLMKHWHEIYHDKYGHEYSGDIKRMSGQATILLRSATLTEIGNSMSWLMDQPQTQFLRHEFDHFVKHASAYIADAKEAKYV